MRRREIDYLRLTVVLLGVLALNGCAQDTGVIQQAKIDEWFYSRLMWMSVAAAILGVLVGLFHLCRLRFLPGELNANRQARKKLGLWLIIMSLAGGSWLLLDAWVIFPFNEFASLNFAEALLSVFLNYRTLVVLLVALIVFTLFVAISTRFFKSDCRCKYTFIPGP
jgi:hypothetical protein